MSKTLKKILYVEDDLDIQKVVKLALEEVGGFTVKLCSSGKKALDCIVAFKPDLVILDVMMPGLNGPDTLQEIHKIPQMAQVPVIFMTAKIQPHEVLEYRKMGVKDVIFKPFDPMALADTIQDIWEK
ncbi:MAG: response regulator [Alphaproteobacteria bacterium]|nr:response regulator [Alphaproteobacteria bacterium]